MPPAVGIGVAGLATAGAGAFGAITAADQASKSRRAAQQQYQYAQQFMPDIFSANPRQQEALYTAMLKQASQPGAYSPAQQRKAEGSLTKQYAKQTEVGRQQVAESSARRGLYRSGIGAQQEAQFLGERGQGLQDALLNLQLSFGQQRMREAAMQQQALAQAAAFQQAQQGQQANLYQSLLGFSGQQAGAAAQQQIAANQALQGAIGGPANLLMTYGLMGGFGGGGGAMPAAMGPNPLAYSPNQPGFQYPGLG